MLVLRGYYVVIVCVLCESNVCMLCLSGMYFVSSMLILCGYSVNILWVFVCTQCVSVGILLVCCIYSVDIVYVSCLYSVSILCVVCVYHVCILLVFCRYCVGSLCVFCE